MFLNSYRTLLMYIFHILIMLDFISISESISNLKRPTSLRVPPCVTNAKIFKTSFYLFPMKLIGGIYSSLSVHNTAARFNPQKQLPITGNNDIQNITDRVIANLKTTFSRRIAYKQQLTNLFNSVACLPSLTHNYQQWGLITQNIHHYEGGSGI